MTYGDKRELRAFAKRHTYKQWVPFDIATLEQLILEHTPPTEFQDNLMTWVKNEGPVALSVVVFELLEDLCNYETDNDDVDLKMLLHVLNELKERGITRVS